MELQDIFNTVRDHLLKQGKRSVREKGFLGNSCAYRSSDGAKCAVGCLIIDEHYSSELEGCSVRHPEVLKVIKKSIGELPSRGFELLYHLQEVHDDAPPEEWGNELTKAAASFDLTP